EVLKPARQMPQSTMVTASRPSSARHLRWRCVSRTRRLGLLIRLRAGPRLLHLADQLEKLHRMRPKRGGGLGLDRLGDLEGAGFVDILDEFDADLLELGH